jgi:uncharacterized membrane protein YbhN (UPF0104 family)
MPKESCTTAIPQLTVRLGRYLLPLLLLGLAVHLILPQLTTLDHLLQVIKGMALWAVALAIVMQVLSYLGSGYLLKAIVAVAGQRLSVVRGMLIFTAAASVGLAGGGPVGNVAVTYRWTHGCGVSSEGAVLAGWLPTLFYDATLVVIGIFGPLHLLIVHELSALQAIGFGLMLTLYFLFVAAGHAVSPGVLLAGYGLPLLLGKVSFLPGGVGIVEGTMAALYDGLGVPGGVTVVVILTYRFLSFWLPLLVGFPLVPYLQRACGNARTES